eukprot:2664089-Amphidinium_carterae.1
MKIFASDFAGSQDFITSMGPGNSFVMLYSCPSCLTAPIRIRDWLYGKPNKFAKKYQYYCPTCAAKWNRGTGRSKCWVLP